MTLIPIQDGCDANPGALSENDPDSSIGTLAESRVIPIARWTHVEWSMEWIDFRADSAAAGDAA
jgi:hypothetical protein